MPKIRIDDEENSGVWSRRESYRHSSAIRLQTAKSKSVKLYVDAVDFRQIPVRNGLVLDESKAFHISSNNNTELSGDDTKAFVDDGYWQMRLVVRLHRQP